MACTHVLYEVPFLFYEYDTRIARLRPCGAIMNNKRSKITLHLLYTFVDLVRARYSDTSFEYSTQRAYLTQYMQVTFTYIHFWCKTLTQLLPYGTNHPT